MGKYIQKLYCFVDETGQDAGSGVFIVVCIVILGNPESLDLLLIELENKMGIGITKWHKTQHLRRLAFLVNFVEKMYKNIKVYYGLFKKPINYQISTLKVIQKCLDNYLEIKFEAVVYIDGINTVSAKKFTKDLRNKKFYLKLVKGIKDESMSLIRLADRWAGCLRLVIEGNQDAKSLVKKAENTGLLFKL